MVYYDCRTDARDQLSRLYGTKGERRRLESTRHRHAYAGEEYQKVATEAVSHLDDLAVSRMGPGRFHNLVTTFRQATSLEIGFWDMGLNL